MRKKLLVTAIVALIGLAGGFILDQLKVTGYAGAYGAAVAVIAIAAGELVGKQTKK